MSSNRYLTKAQKDAIIRKIEGIKKEQIKKISDDVRKTYKPSAEEQIIINDAREMNRLFSKIEQIAKKYEDFKDVRIYNSYSHFPSSVDYVRDGLIERAVKQKSKQLYDIDMDDIRMELELAEVKDFNIDEFIKKFV